MKKTHILLIVCFSIFCIGNIKAQVPKYSDEISSLVRLTNTKQRYSDYKPDFHIEKTSYKFHGTKGDYQNTFWEIRDGEKIVAVFLQEPQSQIDVIASTPEKAPTVLNLPPRYHYGAMFGTRFTTIAYWPEFKVSGDKHEFHFSGGGDSLVITESQEWLPDGKYKCKAKSVHTATLRIDPVFGYVFDLNCIFEIDKFIKGGIEFTNLLFPRQSNPWPEKWAFDYTVYSSADTSGYVRFSSNLVAGDLSDEIRHKLKKDSMVQIRLGVDEGFEEQPLSTSTTIRGICKGWWENDFIIDQSIAYHGSKSLRIDGMTEAQSQEKYANFDDFSFKKL